jgi:hypothetical protein
MCEIVRFTPTLSWKFLSFLLDNEAKNALHSLQASIGRLQQLVSKTNTSNGRYLPDSVCQLIESTHQALSALQLHHRRHQQKMDNQERGLRDELYCWESRWIVSGGNHSDRRMKARPDRNMNNKVCDFQRNKLQLLHMHTTCIRRILVQSNIDLIADIIETS